MIPLAAQVKSYLRSDRCSENYPDYAGPKAFRIEIYKS